MSEKDLLTAELKPVSGTRQFREENAVVLQVQSAAEALEKAAKLTEERGVEYGVVRVY